MRSIATELAFRNNTGATIPPGAAMEVSSATVEEAEIIWNVAKPTASGIDKRVIIFNAAAEVTNGNGGEAQHGPVIIARGNGGALSVGDSVGPTSGSWELSPSGTGYTYLGACNLFENAILVRPPGGRFLVHFKSPAGGIDAFDEATGQMGSAVCDKYNSNSTGLLSSAGTTLTIYNAAGAFAGNKYGVADYNEAGLLVAVVEKCN